MLKVRVTKVGNRFEVNTEWKETSLGMPLCTSSAHPWSCHQSWPIALVKSLRQLSSTRAKAEDAKKVLWQRFIDHFSSKIPINLIQSTDVEGRGRDKRLHHPVQECVWLAVGYHPALEMSLKRSIKVFQESAWMHLIGRAYGQEWMPNIRLCWYKAMQSIGTLVGKIRR